MDFFSSFFQNVKEKLTSPFFGTLAFIMLIHHWVFWYTIFNFNPSTSLHLKINALKSIGATEFHWKNIAEDIVWAVIIVLVGYVIIVATRSLSLFIDFGLMPWITKKVINKNVVTRTEFEEISKERDFYAEKFEHERKNGRILSKSYDEQADETKAKNEIITENNSKITELNRTVTKFNETIAKSNQERGELIKELTLSNDQIEDQQKKIEDQQKAIEKLTSREIKLNEELTDALSYFFDEENYKYWSRQTTFPPTIEAKVNEIKSAGLWQGFKDVVSFNRQGGTISAGTFSNLKPFGIMTPDDRERLNSLGRIIADHIAKFDDPPFML